MSERAAFQELQAKYQRVINQHAGEIIVSWKGKIWEGFYLNDGEIAVVPITGLFHNRMVISPSQPRVIMPLRVYDLLIKNTAAGGAEKAGAIFGFPIANGFEVNYFLNFSPGLLHQPEVGTEEKTVGMAKAFGGYAGTLASAKMNQFVGGLRRQSRVIGFYHSHPTRDSFSPGDKREFKKLMTHPSLEYMREPAKLHILCRRSGLHRAFSRYALFPKAYYLLKEIPIVIQKL